MDRQSVYSAHVYEPSFGETSDTRLQLQTQLETFILDFRLDNNFVYRYAPVYLLTLTCSNAHAHIVINSERMLF